ncbi:MAG: alcohol dehydrogenase catalytic domain-containing protein [Chloroflexi bacterium]|nr:alcohol dehydrogenase catalytic domain-containing protein [Chloroflexota bacterium]
MRAAILKDKERFSIEDVPAPRAGPGEAVIKVSYNAICGSDVTRFANARGVGLILGHELCGRIAEVGEGVPGWSVGDLVAVDPITECGKCYWCLHGQGHLCPDRGGTGIAGNPGGYAEYTKALAVQLFHVPERVGEKNATLAQCLAVSLHAVHLAQIKAGDAVAVVGAGPIGLFALQCARLAGAGKVYVSEKAPGRKAAAARLGADSVLDPTEVDVRQALLELTGIGADVAISCAGVPQAVRDSFTFTKAGGVVVVVAESWETQISSDMVSREIMLRGSRTYTRGEFGDAVDLIAAGKVDCEPFITRVEPLANIQRAFGPLIEPTTQVKTLIAP